MAFHAAIVPSSEHEKSTPNFSLCQLASQTTAPNITNARRYPGWYVHKQEISNPTSVFCQSTLAFTTGKIPDLCELLSNNNGATAQNKSRT